MGKVIEYSGVELSVVNAVKASNNIQHATRRKAFFVPQNTMFQSHVVGVSAKNGSVL